MGSGDGSELNTDQEYAEYNLRKYAEILVRNYLGQWNNNFKVDYIDSQPELVLPSTYPQVSEPSGDPLSNCPLTSNSDQEDINGDTIGDACDPTPNGGS